VTLARAVFAAAALGNWAHAYFEAYIDTPLDGNTSRQNWSMNVDWVRVWQ
jgi:hypothetical protein